MAPPKTAEKKPAETVGVTASKGEKRPTGKAPSKSKTKASKKAAGAVGGKRRSKRKESYSSYIYKILKSVHPNIGISNKAILILNSLVKDLFDRLASESVVLLKTKNQSTLNSREIQTAVKLAFPGELAKHAVSEGTKALTKYTGRGA